MAADNYLLDCGPTPCLRLYGWTRPTLSLGYRQRTDWIDRDETERRAIEVVRRPSGGRALLHDDELTYAIVLESEAQPHLPTAFGQLTRLLAHTLQALGVKVETAVEAQLAPSRSHPGCMSITAGGELLYRGRKLVGSAQVCRRKRLLQHGVLPFTVDRQRLAALIPSEGEVMGLTELGGPRVSSQEFAEAFLQANGFSGVTGAWSDTELDAIEEDLERWRINAERGAEDFRG